MYIKSAGRPCRRAGSDGDTLYKCAANATEAAQRTLLNLLASEIGAPASARKRHRAVHARSRPYTILHISPASRHPPLIQARKEARFSPLTYGPESVTTISRPCRDHNPKTRIEKFHATANLVVRASTNLVVHATTNLVVAKVHATENLVAMSAHARASRARTPGGERARPRLRAHAHPRLPACAHTQRAHAHTRTC